MLGNTIEKWFDHWLLISDIFIEWCSNLNMNLVFQSWSLCIVIFSLAWRNMFNKMLSETDVDVIMVGVEWILELCSWLDLGGVVRHAKAANSTILVVDYDFFSTPATFLQYYFHSQQSTIFCQQFPALFESCSLLKVSLIAWKQWCSFQNTV